jgi:hypothetical protein
MADTRSRLDKLLAMARQDESPAERDAARAKLAELGAWPPEPPPVAPFPVMRNGDSMTFTFSEGEIGVRRPDGTWARAGRGRGGRFTVRVSVGGPFGE